MARQKPVDCNDCGHTFPRDPVLEVPCPVCEAPVGVKCASVAPSGHRKSTGFSGLPPWGHDERDFLAAADGHYLHDCTVGDLELHRRMKRAQVALGHAMNPDPGGEMPEMTDRFPVPCPRDYCGAQVGEPCRSAAGNLTMAHTPRRTAAEKAGTPIQDLDYDEQVAYLKATDPAPPAPVQLALF